MAISAPGIGSNLDVASIVAELVQLEQRPLLLLAQKEASFQARLSNLGVLKGGLSSLQAASSSLSKVDSVSLKASSTDSSSVSASAGATALPGAHSVSVTALAQAQKIVSAGQASATTDIGGGADTTVTISFGTIAGGTLTSGVYSGASFTANAAKPSLSVTIDSSNNTLEGIRDAINSANGGVTASIINDGGASPYRLALTSNDTGAANSLKIAVSGEAALSTLLAYDPAATQQFTQSQAAQNAALTVDSTPVTSASNTVAGAIQGVTLTLGKVTTSPVTISVSRDFASAGTTAAALVKAYNDLNSSIATATAKGAAQQGDIAFIGVQQRLRAALGGSYGSSGAFRTLSSLGITFNRDGALELNTSKLSAALAADPSGALTTLAQAGTAVNTLTGAALGSRGAVQSGTTGINSSLKTIEAQRERIQRHIQQVEQNYRAQFTALDTLLGRMRQTSDFLTQQLAKLPTINNTNGN